MQARIVSDRGEAIDIARDAGSSIYDLPGAAAVNGLNELTAI